MTRIRFTSGKRRGLLRVIFTRTLVYPYPCSSVITRYDVNVESQKQNFWGHWDFPPCPNECWVSGSWTPRFDLISLSTLAYVGAVWGRGSWSYPHLNCIINFWGSFNVLSGANIGYGTGVMFGAQTGTGFQEVTVSPMLWKASVPGGSSGINLSISN